MFRHRVVQVVKCGEVWHRVVHVVKCGEVWHRDVQALKWGEVWHRVMQVVKCGAGVRSLSGFPSLHLSLCITGGVEW